MDFNTEAKDYIKGKVIDYLLLLVCRVLWPKIKPFAQVLWIVIAFMLFSFLSWLDKIGVVKLSTGAKQFMFVFSVLVLVFFGLEYLKRIKPKRALYSGLAQS